MNFLRFLYFSKSERVAIVTLLILIIICGGLYYWTRNSKTPADKSEWMNKDEFRQFEAKLKVKEEENKKQSKGYTYKEYGKTYIPQKKLQAGETIELNSADTLQLKMIPGIGTGYANRIVKYRDILGGYNSIIQLKEVWGMDDYLYKKIIPYIELKSKPKRINVNHAGLEQINKHPYINYKQATVIIDIRDRKGPIESIERLALLEEFTEEDIRRLKPYLSFE